MGEVLFVTGGARSGKSQFAERLARQHSETGAPVVYLATMEPLDEELRLRVARHRADRPSSWTTTEAPLAIVEALSTIEGDACVLLDCLSLWVANRLMPLGEAPTFEAVGRLEADLDAELEVLLEIAGAREGALIVVTNEVGAGVVPETPLGRIYRDLLGRANQRVALGAVRAWLLVAGRALELPAADPHPSPLP